VPVHRHRHPVIGYARGWRRYLFLIPAIVVPVMIALARMYRGEHHPTDILGSLLFAGLWLTAATLLIRPTEGGLDRAGRRPLGLPHRKDADHSREAAPATRSGSRRNLGLDTSRLPAASGGSSAAAPPDGGSRQLD
jgi:hypothetical protein